MRFQCLEITCGKPFGWTAKKIVKTYPCQPATSNTPASKAIFPEEISYEYVVCPYCGSLDFDEYRNGLPSKPVAAKPVPPIRYPAPASQPIQPTQDTSQFDPADLMQHSWKGKKDGQGGYEHGSISYGWDFKDKFAPATIQELQIQGTISIDQYEFSLNRTGSLVSAKKAKQT